MSLFRSFALISVCMVLLFPSCSSNQKQKLFIYNWTYYTPDQVLRAFEKEFNCTVVYDVFASNEEMFAKLKAGGTGYDITFPSGDYVSIMIKEDMLEKIDHSRVPNAANIDTFVTNRTKYDPGCSYSVPYIMGCSGISVNKKMVAQYDKSWNIFSRTDLKGKMSMLEDMREVIGAALKSLGYSCNTVDTAQLAQAKKVVVQWKNNILRFDAEAFGKAIAAGEVAVVQGYAENVFAELDSAMRPDIEFFIPKEGGTSYVDNMVILKDAANKDLAYKFLDYIHRPDVMARIVDTLRLPCLNTIARTLRTRSPLYDLENLNNCELKEDLGPSLELYNAIWQEIRVGS